MLIPLLLYIHFYMNCQHSVKYITEKIGVIPYFTFSMEKYLNYSNW